MTEDRRTVAVKSHGHVVVATFYKISDELKQAKIETKVRWSEHEFEKDLTGSAERFESEQPGATKGAAAAVWAAALHRILGSDFLVSDSN